MKHFEKKTKEKKKKIPGKKALTELLNTKNGGGDVWGEVGIAQSLIAKKIKPKKRGKDKTSGEPLSIVAFIKQFPKVRNTVLLIAAEEAAESTDEPKKKSRRKAGEAWEELTAKDIRAMDVHQCREHLSAGKCAFDYLIHDETDDACLVTLLLQLARY